MGKHRVKADVCLILEGTYPYVSGGLSSWTHDLIRMQDHLRFSLLTIMPPGFEGRAVYELPRNVVEVHQVR